VLLLVNTLLSDLKSDNFINGAGRAVHRLFPELLQCCLTS
jgi:hypothetical protein